MLRRSRPLILAFMLLTVCSACGKRPNLQPITISRQEHQVFYSDQSQWTEEAGVVIRNQDEWLRHWEMVTGSRSDLPAVDFQRDMLLLFNAGRRYPGDRVQILELVPGSEGELTAIYRIEESGTRQSAVYPVQVVKVPRRPGEVRFQRQRFDSTPG